MRLSTKISLILSLIFSFLILAGPVLVFAQGGVNFIEIENPLKYDKIEDIIKAITGLLKTVALPIATLMIVWGGIQIMVGYSTGEKEKKVTEGKKTITYAVIGYAIIFLVDFITGFVKEIIGAK